MEIFLFYLLRVTIAATVLYLFFKFILSKRTFHAINRIVVLSMVVMTLVLPMFTIPLPEINFFQPKVETAIAQPIEVEMIAPLSAGSNTNIAAVESKPVYEIPWIKMLGVMYLIGFTVALLRFAISFIRMSRIIRRTKKVRLDDNSLLCISDKKVSPFSWMRFIVLSKEDYDVDSRDIIRHEQAHVAFGHSYDLLFLDLYSLVFWFNPFAWLLRLELQTIHEYQADEKVLAEGANAQNYHLSLIRQCVGEYKFALANNFEYNNLHKRIKMTMKTKSSSNQKWLYGTIGLSVMLCIGLLSCNKLKSSQPTTNKTVIAVDTVAPATIDNRDLKLITGVVVDLDNHPLVNAMINPDRNGAMYQISEADGSFSVPTELGKKLTIYANDGSHFKGQFVVSDSTQLQNLKIVLQGNIDKNNWTGVKIYHQTPAEALATKQQLKAYLSKHIDKSLPPRTYRTFSDNWNDMIVVKDGKVLEKKDRFSTPENEILFASSSGEPKLDSKYGRKALRNTIYIETKEGTKNALIFLNDTPISHKEMLTILADHTILRTVSVIRDKSKCAAYGDKAKNGVVIIRTYNKKYRNTIKTMMADERLVAMAKANKDRAFKIHNIKVFGNTINDNSIAVFINGKLANKAKFNQLKLRQIKLLTISDIYYYKNLAKQFNLKQKAVLMITTKQKV